MQGGLNTFGCLINGKAFVPGGGGILSNTLSVQYDPKFQGGKLSIVARNYPDATNFYGVGILGDSIKTTGTFSLQLHSKYVITYVDTRVNCNFHTYYDMPIAGELIITRFDTITRIISGTFTFKVTTSSCGIIDGTEGRFDVKY